VIKLDVKKIFQGQPRILTRDLVAIANLVCHCQQQGPPMTGASVSLKELSHTFGPR